mmetsp:Transcript_19368/g.46809  ORF Transcript_19368/g.46809 Transcript_19368/m.46809 type:complete len:92 (-) Transcript_19368:200-475(-)
MRLERSSNVTKKKKKFNTLLILCRRVSYTESKKTNTARPTRTCIKRKTFFLCVPSCGWLVGWYDQRLSVGRSFGFDFGYDFVLLSHLLPIS